MAEVNKQILVSANQGSLDTLTTVGRLVVIVLSTAPAAALLVRKHDLVGLYNYFQSQPGLALAGAVSGLAAVAYGIYKSFKRGAQVAGVATDNRVPASVADIK